MTRIDEIERKQRMTHAAENPPRAGGHGNGEGGPDPCRRGVLLGLLSLPLTLGACGMFSGGGGASPRKEPTRLAVAITAARDLNTDAKGRGAPMLLRVFELRSDVAFQEAGFFALQDNVKAVLGPDLLTVDQFIVRPGETREIRRNAHPEAVAIGVFAGYRDLPHAVWRVVHKLPPAPDAGWYRAVMPAHKVVLGIELQGNAIVLIDEAAQQPPARFANESLKGLASEPDPGVGGAGGGIPPPP
jgi:type VI secretion system protein VasD